MTPSPDRRRRWAFRAALATSAVVGMAAAPARPALCPWAVEPLTFVALDRVPLTPGTHTLSVDARLAGQPVRLRGELFLPATRPSRGCPLVVSLPTGSAADPVMACLTASHGPVEVPDDAFAVLAPRCPAGHTWAEPSTQTLLREWIDAVVVDNGLAVDRVYLTGGGPAAADAWQLAVGLPDRWAGVAPLGGRGPVNPAATVDALWRVGVCVGVDPADDGERPMAAALAVRPHQNFTTRRLPPAGPAAAYTDPTFWRWLLAKRRAPDAATPTARDPNVHLGRATVIAAANPSVTVTVDAKALPTRPGFSVVPATLRLGDRTLPFDFGLYLPPGFPRAVGYRGGAVPTLVNLHWREFFGGGDEQVTQETLAKLLVRFPIEVRHQGELPADPVALTGVAPAICLMPHCPGGCRFERTPGMAEAIGLLIDRVVPALGADPDRVFLTGVSYGGSEAWAVGQRIADRLAGIVPCDGRRTADPPATAAALADVGVYISAGDRDGDFTNDARVMVAALAAAGHADTVYREVRGGNHFCFSSTYTDPAFWAWLSGRRRTHRLTAEQWATGPSVSGSVLLASSVGDPAAAAPVAPASKPVDVPKPPAAPVVAAPVAPPAPAKAVEVPKPAAAPVVAPPPIAPPPQPAPAAKAADPARPAAPGAVPVPPAASPAPVAVKVADAPKPAKPAEAAKPAVVPPAAPPTAKAPEPAKPAAAVPVAVPPAPAPPPVAKVPEPAKPAEVPKAAVVPPPAVPPKPAEAAKPAVPPGPLAEVTIDPKNFPTTPGYHVVRLAGQMDGKPKSVRFGLWLPANYGSGDPHAPTTWPVVVSLHNKGSIGGDANGSVTGESLPFLLTHDGGDGRWSGDRPRSPIDLHHAAAFICLVPQCPTGHTWDDPAEVAVLDQLLEATIANCHGDPERTYLTGFSFGASNTWLVGQALAGHFAAIAPMDGRATPNPAATVAALGKTGIYLGVGGVDDGFVPEAKRMLAALAAGPHPDFAFRVVPNGNHFCYGSVYTDPLFWDWMFAHRRTPPPAKPTPPPAPAAAVVAPPVPAGVVVKLDPAALPHGPGYAVVRPTVTVDGKPLSVPVGVWLPANFARPSAPLPVIVSLHNRYAIGMDGSDQALLGEGLPRLLHSGNHNHGDLGEMPRRPVNPATDVSFIGLFPQCPAGQSWEAGPMPEVIDKVIAAVLSGYGTATADPDRVTLTGWSYGASCVWAVASAYPGRFAAVAVNDGRASPNPAETAVKLKDVAIYLAAGDNDGDFTNAARQMLDALAAARHPNFVHRTIARGGHQSYTSVYADPAFWGWLLAQSRRH